LKKTNSVLKTSSHLRFALLVEDFLLAGVSEAVLLAVLVGELQENLGQFGVDVAEVAEHSGVLGVQELGQLGDGAHVLGGRAHLGAHVLGNTSGLTWSIVVLRHFVLAEDLQRGVAADGVLAAGLLASFRAVNLGQFDWRIVVLHELRRLGVLGLQSLAVAAPITRKITLLGHVT